MKEEHEETFLSRRWVSIGIRSWGPPGGTQFGTIVFLSVTLWEWRCYGPQRLCLEKWEENWEDLRESGSPLLFLLDSPASASLLFRLQGYFHVYTQCTICYFAAWLIINPPMCWSNWNLCPFTLSGSEHCEELGIQGWRQFHSLIQLVWWARSHGVIVTACISSCWSSAGCCRLLPGLANEGLLWNGVEPNAAVDTGGMCPTPCSKG